MSPFSKLELFHHQIGWDKPAHFGPCICGVNVIWSKDFNPEEHLDSVGICDACGWYWSKAAYEFVFGEAWFVFGEALTAPLDSAPHHPHHTGDLVNDVQSILRRGHI